MSCQWRKSDTGRYEDCSDVVIPYRSLIEFYRKEQAYLRETEQEEVQQAEKRKRGAMIEERKQAQLKILEKARAAKVREAPKFSPTRREIVEEVNRELA
jgi:hypothetical protein